MSDQAATIAARDRRLTAAQAATIAEVLAEHGPWASYLVERDEPHDTYIFLLVFDGDRRQVLETIVEADGQRLDDD